ncbi:protein chiffon [Eurosta solidaginis]|uniref:protein chiffon n=1 Tax=Eurosta solidaginis TaxID=178769 RepID=UPI003531395B
MQSQSETYKSKFKAKISNHSNSQQQTQRREIQRQQQQQRQQQAIRSSTSATTITKPTAAAAPVEPTETAAAAVGGNHSGTKSLSTQRRATVKVIKCKKPLCHFKFYLDICDHQLAKRIEEHIRTLGGALEFFLTAHVTHFITDKAILPTVVGGCGSNNSSNNNNNNTLSSRPATPQTPGTPNTPQTPYAAAYDTTPTTTTQHAKTNILASVSCNSSTTGTISRKSTNNTRQTRANAILNRVRRASTTTTTINNAHNINAINVNSLIVSLVECTPNTPTTTTTTTPTDLKDVKNKTVAYTAPTTPPIIVSTQNPYIIWRTEYALHFFKKVQHELKDYLGNNNNTHIRHQQAHAHKGLRSSNTVDHIDLKGGGFLKIESVKRNNRPYYQLFRKSAGTEWPKIELTREDGAFRLSPKKKQQVTANISDVQQQQKEKEQAVKGEGDEADVELKMTRKSRSRSTQNQRSPQPVHAALKTLKKSGAAAYSSAKLKSSQRAHACVGGGGGAGAAAAAAEAACKQVKESSDKQCGVCEICKIEYDTLTIHLKTKDHEYFAKNSQNFIALDTLIHTTADVNRFLREDKKVADLEEMEVENIEVMADENAPDPLEGSEPSVVGGGAGAGDGGGGEVVLPATLLDLNDAKNRLADDAPHTPSPTLREKSKRSTKGKHSSEKFQNIRLSKSPKSTKSAATSPHKNLLVAPVTCTTTTSATTTTATAPAPSPTVTTANANAVKRKTSKNTPARRKTISASALSPPLRAMLPPSSLYKVVGTPETSLYGTPSRKMRGGAGGGVGGDVDHEAHVTASPSLIVKFKKVRSTELNRLNGEAESFMFPKQRTSSELPTDIDRQTTSENAHARSESSTSLDTSTSESACSMDIEVCGDGRSKSTSGGKQPMGRRAIAIAKRRKEMKVKSGAAATKQRFPSAPIQPEIQLNDKQGTRKSATATALSKTQQTAAATKINSKTTATKTTTNVTTSLSNNSGPARRPAAALSAAAAKAHAAAAVLAAITLPEATRKSSRTATAIVTAATTSSRLLRAAVEAAKYNCRQMAAGNEQQSLVDNGTPLAAAATTTARPTATTIKTKSTNKRVAVVKMEDRMGDIKNEKKKRIKIEKRSRSDSDEDNDDDKEHEDAPLSKCIKIEKQNKDVTALRAFGVGMADDDDDDDDDEEEVDNDDDKDEDYVHCKRSRGKSDAYGNISALWHAGTINTNSGTLSRKQRAAQREEQKYKLAMLTAAANEKVGLAVKIVKETVKSAGGKVKSSNGTLSKTKTNKTASAATSPSNSKGIVKIETTNSACAPATPTTPTPTPLKPRINEKIKFDLANCAQLNQMRYSFERLPVTDLWYRVFMRQDTSTECFFEYYGSTNYRKLPYELGPIPYAHTIKTGICCKLCEKQRNTSATDFMSASSSKEVKIKRAAVGRIKYEPIEDSEAGASKSRDSSSGKANDLMENTTNSCSTGNYGKTLATAVTTTTTSTATTTNSTNTNITQYTHKHKKLAFLQRYRQEQQELQKLQAAATSEQHLSSAHQLADYAKKCDDNVSTPPEQQERTPRERKRAGSTQSTTSSTSCASSTATAKTKKNRYFNKHLNKAAAAFLNLELPPRKSPREHASTLALVSCLIKQRQDSQSKPNSETDEPPPSTIAGGTAAVDVPPLTPMLNAATKPSQLTTEPNDNEPKSIAAAPANSEMPTVLRSPRHTRSAAATPDEEIRFTTVISENVKRMRRGQNKYDHSPPVALTQRTSLERKSGRGRPPRTYAGLQKCLYNAGSAITDTNLCSTATSGVVMSSSAALESAAITGDRRRRVKRGPGWTSTLGLMAGGRRRHHSHYTGLQAQGSALPTIRKTGSKKGVLEFEVDTTALKALEAATQYTNTRHLEWQIDNYLQFFGREYDLELDDDLALRVCESADTSNELSTAELTTTSMSSTKKCNTTAATTTTSTAALSASTSKALQRACSLNGDVKRSISSSTALTQIATAASFDGSTNTPPPTDYFSSDFDLYDLFTKAVGGAGGAASDDEKTADMSGKRKNTRFSVYNSLAMQNYFRKRKSLKSNRTGWPKVQKKKTSVRQQHILARKIRFLQDIGELTSNNGNGIKKEPNGEDSKVDEEVLDDYDAGTTSLRDSQRKRRDNGVITPPQSEMEIKQNIGDEEDTEIDAAESGAEEEDEEDVEDDEEEEELEDDGETMAETIDEEDYEAEVGTKVMHTERDADAAAEADEEDVEDADMDLDVHAAVTAGEEDNDNNPVDDDDTLMDDNSRLHLPATRKPDRRQRRQGNRKSPREEVETRLTTNVLITSANISSSNNNGATSTPTKQLLSAGSSNSALRRTPQLLNGSLGSCISPSEKAGDNSDIFTVSSDGLDTDLDMSNSQHKGDDEHLHHHHHHHQHLLHQDQCANHQQTPKRKFDLSKYAPNNAASSRCAAEAATAAVKSLAISQFLKKEVRVQCRRLRAPFRRYRYRR